MSRSIFKSFAIVLAVFRASTVADFQLYSLYDEDALIAGLALSSTCLSAL